MQLVLNHEIIMLFDKSLTSRWLEDRRKPFIDFLLDTFWERIWNLEVKRTLSKRVFWERPVIKKECDFISVDVSSKDTVLFD
jgi:hypothetical protein